MGEQRTSNRVADLGALLLAVAVPAAIVAPVLARGEVWAIRDLVDFFYPMKVFLRDSLRAGEIPWWDPWNYCGIPFFANLQSGVFYPPNWIHALLPVPRAFALYVLFHLSLAAAGGFALGRILALRPAACALVGLSLSLSGWMLSTIELSNNLSTAAWVPGLAASALALVRSPSRPRFGLTAILLAMAILGGEPHLALLGFGLAAALAFTAAGPGRGRALLLLFLAGLLAVALTAFQVFPFLAFAARSERLAGYDLEISARNSLPPRQLVEIVDPPAGRTLLDFAGIEGYQTYYPLLYAGIVPLALALVSLLSRRHAREVLLLLSAIAVGILLSLGDHAPLFPALHRTGLLASFRYPAKFLLLVFVPLAALAGIGLDALLGRTRRPRVLAIAVVLAAALDLLLAHAGSLPSADPARLWAPSPIHAFLRERDAGAPARVYPRPQTRGREAILVGRTPAYLDYLGWKGLLLDGAIPQAVRIPSARGGAAIHLPWNEALVGRMDSGDLGALRLSSTSYFLSWEEVPHPGLRFLLRDRGVFLYEVRGALPRAFVPKRWELAEDPRVLARRAGEEDVLSGATALFEAHPPDHPEPSGEPGAGSVRLIERRSSRVVLETEMSSPGVVVLNDTWAPGWTAKANGRALPVHRVNGTFRGVFVPRARATVVLAYRPPGLRAGAVISLAAAAAALALFIPRRPPHPGRPSGR